ncbi:ribosomal protein L11 methyltransferase [Marivirga tractuosa]|uniref:Ribosomal protein L11 methyltransferase n=1 Tax=Marivirga tractuosa (strain ATCC 23168 / DSM 4126 / NBRC 15989 / NCIMB 1408 / VKM B-1430 / H-43) TaxID=643867 RepID=E4TPL5_MARTH|nr:50S ribosomal protein L11 methyltransferase [Marivirga tractuosa]ADR22579.1 ribosomal L11 methyltransferase [Marivirga tractuosa DSM 4126]BDD16750.1 ribosomal protein L11 methyltransferase [Marivirga tractuosa]
MSYISLEVNCHEEFIEIFMAELAEIGFSTFQEKEDGNGLFAYSEENQKIEASQIEELFQQYESLTSVTYELGSVEKENWNADWEKNYQPIEVENKILVRADFHPSNPKFPTEIVVTPKMSFGTGHHETTYQMLNLMHDMDLKGAEVLDAGCGTGILAILAAIKGAGKVEAYDIDEWAVENTNENFLLNSVDSSIYKVWQGEVQTIPQASSYDLILANINKNILLADIQHLQKHIKKTGFLMLSGFYENDNRDILNECENCSLELISQSVRNQWSALLLKNNK